MVSRVEDWLTLGVLLVTGTVGHTARMFDLSTGALKWEARVGSPDTGLRQTGPPGLGSDVLSVPGAILVLSEGSRVTRLDEKTGVETWGWEFPGGG